MLPLIFISKFAIYAVMVGSLIAAVGVVTLPNLFRSALCLAATLVGVAGLYLALQAEFIAVVQILLYVGAVMTLVIFAVMLTERIADPTIPQTNRQSGPAFLSLAAFVGLVGSLLLKTDWARGAALEPASPLHTSALAQALLGEYVFPFEVVSVVLIAALIGAIVIARRD